MDDCILNVNSGNYDQEAPLVMAIDFEQVLSKICLAWHFRNMTDEDLGALSREDYQKLRNTVPNFGFNLSLMVGIDCEGEILGRPFNRSAVECQLKGAKEALDKCIQKASSGSYDEEPPLVMAVDFSHVLHHLCLAWHFKHMTGQEIDELPPEEFGRLSRTVRTLDLN